MRDDQLTSDASDRRGISKRRVRFSLLERGSATRASMACVLAACACSDMPTSEGRAAIDQTASALVCGVSPSDYQNLVISDEPGFDSQVFADTVVAGLGDRYMGYAFTLLNAEGERIVLGEYGLARTACEPEGQRRFTMRTKTNWGSVSKMLGFTAAMHRLENAPGAGQYVPTMESRIRDFLPKRWRNPVPPFVLNDPGLDDVRMWHLFEHKAGFLKTKSAPIWERLWTLPENDVGIGERLYSNTSASSLQAIPYFFDPEFAEAADDVYGQQDFETYGEIMYYVGTVIYHDYVQEHLLEPLGISAQCNISEFPDGNWSKYYSGPTDDHGNMLNDTLWESRCAAGGWMLSTLSMGKFAHALSRTELLISSEGYAKMAFTPKPDRRKGWASYALLDDGVMFAHDGIRSIGQGRALGQMTAFPNGFVAVGATNSRAASSGASLQTLFRQAYEAARDAGSSLQKSAAP